MDPTVSIWIQLVARWFHVVGGVVWIGFLFFFALVQLEAFAAMGESRPGAARELMPRGLWWFRWMAALTVATGLVLLWIIYYVDDTVYDAARDGNPAGTVAAIIGSLVAVALYDQATARIEHAPTAHLISAALLGATYWLFSGLAHFAPRAVWIHVGSAMGIALIVNVWIRVWPAAKNGILPALAREDTPDPEAMKVIATRARRSLYIAIPLLFLMISNHYPSLYASPNHGLYFSILVIAGWLFALACLRRAKGLRP
ncbi:MAG: urate hydroxylase PuuD [Thermoanaerobaculia bacterium]|nr:urate hydroxylase PuuD [Thermoanaerobaculia bacterium]